MPAGWEDILTRIETLAGHDKKRVAEGAAQHGYQFEVPPDADAWLAEHGAWLDGETRAFTTIAEVFELCPTMDEFRTGFMVRELEFPFAMRLCSFWNVLPPSQYAFEESDPEPGTVRYRWFDEQYMRQRTRTRFQGGLGGVMKMLPRRAKKSKG